MSTSSTLQLPTPQHQEVVDTIQAFFIVQRRYPLAYNKWIREQIAVQMGLEDLYFQCKALLTLADFVSAEFVQKADTLRRLVTAWC